MAARKPPLRAVAEGEKPPEKPAKTLLEAVMSGDYLAELKATHLRIVKAVNDPSTSPRDLAALTRRQLEIREQIRAAELAQEEEAVGANASPDEPFDSEAI